MWSRSRKTSMEATTCSGAICPLKRKLSVVSTTPSPAGTWLMVPALTATRKASRTPKTDGFSARQQDVEEACEDHPFGGGNDDLRKRCAARREPEPGGEPGGQWPAAECDAEVADEQQQAGEGEHGAAPQRDVERLLEEVSCEEACDRDEDEEAGGGGRCDKADDAEAGAGGTPRRP